MNAEKKEENKIKLSKIKPTTTNFDISKMLRFLIYTFVLLYVCPWFSLLCQCQCSIFTIHWFCFVYLFSIHLFPHLAAKPSWIWWRIESHNILYSMHLIVSAEQEPLLDSLGQEVHPFISRNRQQFHIVVTLNFMFVAFGWTGRQWLPALVCVEGLQYEFPFEFQVLKLCVSLNCIFMEMNKFSWYLIIHLPFYSKQFG